MAQAMSVQTPDLVEKNDDPTMGTTAEHSSGEKKSVFGKLKEKTKNKTDKLKRKLKPGSGGDDAAGGDTSSSSSSSEDEADAPTQNPFSGMTQPQYERKLESGEISSKPDDGSSQEDSSPLRTEEFNKKTPSDFPPSHGQEEASLSKQFQGLSTDETKSQEQGEDSTLPGDKIPETPLDEGLGGKIHRDNILKNAGNPAADDTDVAKDKIDPEGLLSGEKSPAGASKTWGQWVGEKVGLGKPSSPTSEISPGDKPITQKLQESAVGAKDTVVAKTSEAADATKSTLEENKQTAATTDPQKQTYTQKLTGAIYGAKDSLMSSTQPGEEDKALSQKVTETVSNLPSTLKSSLGFGGNKSPTTSSPTTTPSLDTPIPTEESPSAPHQSPGIVSRITGSVTSLFGSGKNKPSDSSTTTVNDTATTPTSGVPSSEATTMETDN